MTCFVFLVATAALRLTCADIGNVTLRGHSGAAFRSCLKNQVEAQDAAYLVAPFTHRNELVGGWRGEFWGKYMHTAAPCAKCTDDPKLMKSVRESMAMIIAAQEPDGYIGCYRKDDRANKGWDVWGNKYTMLGLLHGYELTGDPAALAAARRLCDYLVGEFGEGRRNICETGMYCGLASLSIVEPVVWLARVTGERKYLDFAACLIRQMEGENGPQLLELAAIPPCDRKFGDSSREYPLKAYEMMSCYQGLADYALATDDMGMLGKVIAAAEVIAKTEITLAGGGAASERWCRCAETQARPLSLPQETCVTITWMRLCEKLLAATGDSKWADEIERSFYNAYLAALKRDGSSFASYTPMGGTRSMGSHHCYLEIDCCNANGPRGFLTFLNTLAMSGKDGIYLNWYDTSDFKAKLPDGEMAEFEVFSYYPSNHRPYPCDPQVRISCRTKGEREFTLFLRIPAWSETTEIFVNGKKDEKPVNAGGYYAVRRVWKEGDYLDVNFDMRCRKHVIADSVAFTVGPILLARDTRFMDGDLSECVVKKRIEMLDDCKKPFCCSVAVEDEDVWMEYALRLPIGEHVSQQTRNAGRVIRFCDFSSAGNRWSQKNFYATFLRMDFGAIWL